MGGGGGPGGIDMNNMKNIMGSNPAMQNMMKDPAFLKGAFSMLNDPKNKAMMDMMAQQNPGMKPVLMMLGFVGKMSNIYFKAKEVFANKFVKLFLFGLFVILVAYYFS